MEALIETLKVILSTDMLGESVSWLAQNLHYKGRSSIYRIKEGTATLTAVREICSRLHEYQHVSEDDLLRIEATIRNVDYFSQLIRNEMNREHPDWVFQSILPLILDCYDYFSPGFQKEILPTILQLRNDDPTAFFYALAYYYIKNAFPNFYSVASSHQERCRRVAGGLGKKLSEVLPGNRTGFEMAEECGQGFIYDIEAPTKWSVVEHVARIIQTFGDPGTTSIEALTTVLIPQLNERTFWQGNRADKVIVMQAVSTGPGRGVYLVLSLDCRTMELNPFARFYFYDETSLSIENLDDSSSQLGFYNLSENTLSIEWAQSDDNPTGFGNSWKRIDISNNTALYKFDKTTSMSDLCGLALIKDGWEPFEELRAKDVIISREFIRILFKNETSVEIARSEWPELSKVTADAMVVVLRHIASDTVYISWPTIGLAIPYENCGG